MSTKIHSTGGIPALPPFVIYGRKVGERELSRDPAESRYFGRTLYSPRHHVDASGRPIPAIRTREGRYVPTPQFASGGRPSISVHALDKPAPAAPARKVAKRFKAVPIPTNTQRSR